MSSLAENAGEAENINAKARNIERIKIDQSKQFKTDLAFTIFECVCLLGIPLVGKTLGKHFPSDRRIPCVSLFGGLQSGVRVLADLTQVSAEAGEAFRRRLVGAAEFEAVIL